MKSNNEFVLAPLPRANILTPTYEQTYTMRHKNVDLITHFSTRPKLLLNASKIGKFEWESLARASVGISLIMHVLLMYTQEIQRIYK